MTTASATASAAGAGAAFLGSTAATPPTPTLSVLPVGLGLKALPQETAPLRLRCPSRPASARCPSPTAYPGTPALTSLLLCICLARVLRLRQHLLSPALRTLLALPAPVYRCLVSALAATGLLALPPSQFALEAAVAGGYAFLQSLHDGGGGGGLTSSGRRYAGNNNDDDDDDDDDQAISALGPGYFNKSGGRQNSNSNGRDIQMAPLRRSNSNSNNSTASRPGQSPAPRTAAAGAGAGARGSRGGPPSAAAAAAARRRPGAVPAQAPRVGQAAVLHALARGTAAAAVAGAAAAAAAAAAGANEDEDEDDYDYVDDDDLNNYNNSGDLYDSIIDQHSEYGNTNDRRFGGTHSRSATTNAHGHPAAAHGHSTLVVPPRGCGRSDGSPARGVRRCHEHSVGGVCVGRRRDALARGHDHVAR